MARPAKKSASPSKKSAPRKVRFRLNEIARATRAVRKAGLPVAKVEIDPVTEKITVIPGKPGEAPDNDMNEWDAK
jgi:hypothetical protein